jgi:hypothetical protein
MMMLVDVALAVDQQRELAQRPAAYASPLAFEWQPQAPSAMTCQWMQRLGFYSPDIRRSA